MMKLRTALFISLFVCLFVIGSVSAASNTTDTSINSDVNDEKLSYTTTDTSSENVADKSTDTVSEKKSISTKKETDDKLSSKPDNVLKETDNGTFTALNKKINDNDEITLENDYKYDDTDNFPYGITIDKKITIHGNGKTINANGKSRIFNVNGGTLILENLKLINGQKNDYGGAIYAHEYSQLTIINSTFINNNATTCGGAISAELSNIILINSTLQNNNASSGGAIYANFADVRITSSKLQNNKANKGGAIYTENSQLNITQTTLQNNQAKSDGGAIWATNMDWLAVNHNVLLNNTGNYVIYLPSSTSDLLNLDYNWFGHTATNYMNTDRIIDPQINNWLFLNATANPDTIIGLSGYSDIVFKLYLYNSSSNKVSSYDNSQLKPVNLTLTSVNGDIDKHVVRLGEKITYTPSTAGTGSVTASINNVKYTINLKITNPDQQESNSSKSGNNKETNKQSNTKKPTFTQTKIVKSISKKAKKLKISTTLKIGNKKATKGKKVTFKIGSKIFKVKTNNKGVAKLIIKKAKLQKILKKVKIGKKIKVQIKYGKTTVTRYIKVKK